MLSTLFVMVTHQLLGYCLELTRIITPGALCRGCTRSVCCNIFMNGLLTKGSSIQGLGALPNSLQGRLRILSDRVGRWHFIYVCTGGSFVPH